MKPLLQRRYARYGGSYLSVGSGAALLASISLFAFPLLLLGRSPLQQESREEPSASKAAATVIHLKLLLKDGTPALEIITTSPVSPKIKLDQPMRLVIELPNTNMSVSQKSMPVKSDDLSAIRLELSPTDPPLVRLEVDL